MIGAGTIINPILKVLTTVAILAAAYYFIVRPALDTTEKVSQQVSDQVQQAQQQGQQFADDINLDVARSRAESYISSLQSSWPRAATEVSRCIKTAGDDGAALEGCATFAQQLVHAVQSDRSFALSYANSLDAQGRDAAAKRVTACVEHAGFKPGPMEHCRQLSDKLLFG